MPQETGEKKRKFCNSRPCSSNQSNQALFCPRWDHSVEFLNNYPHSILAEPPQQVLSLLNLWNRLKHNVGSFKASHQNCLEHLKLSHSSIISQETSFVVLESCRCCQNPSASRWRCYSLIQILDRTLQIVVLNWILDQPGLREPTVLWTLISPLSDPFWIHSNLYSNQTSCIRQVWSSFGPRKRKEKPRHIISFSSSIRIWSIIAEAS